MHGKGSRRRDERASRRILWSIPFVACALLLACSGSSGNPTNEAQDGATPLDSGATTGDATVDGATLTDATSGADVQVRADGAGPDDSGADSNTAATGDGGGSGDAGASGDAGGSADAGDGGSPGVTYAYAHTNTTLYEFDPTQATLSLTQVGNFDCIGAIGDGGAAEDSSMTDLAVDRMGNLWGVSEHNAYALQIQGSIVHCAKTIPLVGVPAGVVFYALSFVPAGVIDANAETLLAGDTQGDLWRIDTTTGALEQHGNFGTVPANDGRGHTYPSDPATTGTTTTVGTPWQLSGDIVFLANTADGGSGSALGFATVRDCAGVACSKTDTLIQIDPTKLGTVGTPVTGNVTLALRGQVVKSAGCADTTNASYGQTFGIAAWNSTIYGFSHSSYIVEIDNDTGAACAVSGPNTAESWSGAAVTTIAPVIAPP